MMNLIRELRKTGKPVIISNCSSDMLLFKASGATHCATGKFFNLRRFTKSRYDDSPGGGGQLPYWFEPNLMAFLREADVLRLKNERHSDLITTQVSNNCWAKEILDNFQTTEPKAWIGMGWRQYLCWFGQAEKELSGADSNKITDEWLKKAENNWIEILDDGILMDEIRNNGNWLRPWRQALGKFKKDA